MNFPERLIPNLRARRVLLAIQEVMGVNGLNIILRRARLERYINRLPPANREGGMRAAEFAALSQSVEEYYGTGARGMLNRIGREVFAQSMQENKVAAAVEGVIGRVLPAQLRLRQALNRLAADLSAPDSKISVHLDDRRLVVAADAGDAAVGRTSSAPVCHLMVGEIQAAAYQATGREFDVVETSCRAKGDAACRFEIGESLE